MKFPQILDLVNFFCQTSPFQQKHLFKYNLFTSFSSVSWFAAFHDLNNIGIFKMWNDKGKILANPAFIWKVVGRDLTWCVRWSRSLFLGVAPGKWADGSFSSDSPGRSQVRGFDWVTGVPQPVAVLLCSFVLMEIGLSSSN